MLAELVATKVIPIIPLDEIAIKRAARTVLEGGVVAYPTDTAYGLGCDPRNEAAVGRLFRIKGREAKAIPVLCADLDRAAELVIFNDLALELARTYWPGPLTIVLPLSIQRHLPNQLHQGTGRLGVRVPDHSGCLSLMEAIGGWITGTSANISRAASCTTANEVLRQLGRAVDMILDGGTLAGGASTVVNVQGSNVEVLRRGAIGLESGAF